MTFTADVRVAKKNPLARVVWNDGVLSGDPVAVRQLAAFAKDADGFMIGPPPNGWTDRDHINNGYSLLWLMRVLFAEVRVIDPLPPLTATVAPEGSVF